MIEEMQHYYDRRAAIYDTSMGYDNPDTVTQLQPVIEHICREMSGEKVLELACGPCFWTQFTAAVAESIVACDFNNSTLPIPIKTDFSVARPGSAIIRAYR